MSGSFCASCGNRGKPYDLFCRACGGALTEAARASGPIAEAASLVERGMLAQAIATVQRALSAGAAPDLNNVVFRSWTDFSGYREERGSVVLEAIEEQRNFRLHVPGTNRDAAVKALARLLSPSGAKRTSGGARARGRSTAKA